MSSRVASQSERWMRRRDADDRARRARMRRAAPPPVPFGPGNRLYEDMVALTRGLRRALGHAAAQGTARTYLGAPHAPERGADAE